MGTVNPHRNRLIVDRKRLIASFCQLHTHQQTAVGVAFTLILKEVAERIDRKVLAKRILHDGLHNVGV